MLRVRGGRAWGGGAAEEAETDTAAASQRRRQRHSPTLRRETGHVEQTGTQGGNAGQPQQAYMFGMTLESTNAASTGSTPLLESTDDAPGLSLSSSVSRKASSFCVASKS